MTLAAAEPARMSRSGSSRAAVRVIVNPMSGRGRGGTMLPAIREAFAGVGVTGIEVTSAAGEEHALAERALADGATTLVAVGGDGTWSNVANAILDAGASSADCRLALLASGTGNDFAKTLGAPVQIGRASCREVEQDTSV